jgi:hypothetical protein
MNSVLRAVGNRKKSQRLGNVQVVDRVFYGEQSHPSGGRTKTPERTKTHHFHETMAGDTAVARLHSAGVRSRAAAVQIAAYGLGPIRSDTMRTLNAAAYRFGTGAFSPAAMSRTAHPRSRFPGISPCQGPVL